MKVLRGRVTPHGLKRYFVRRIYDRHCALGKAQLLARQRSMITIQRYVGATNIGLEEMDRDAADNVKRERIRH